MKPSDFYLGVTEFMAVLVPGFLTAAAILELMGDADFARIESSMDWLLLTIMAYVLGQVLFALGSKWDVLYDIFKGTANQEHLEAVKEVRKQVSNDLDCEKINQYQWCRSLLLNDYPAAFQEVARKEADSKLFRSLLAPLMFWMVYLGTNENPNLGLLGLILVVVCFWRFAGLRRKACRIAYTHVIHLASRDRLAKDPN